MESSSTHQLAQEPLVDLLQVLEWAGSSVDLQVHSDRGAASLAIRKGQLLHAEFGHHYGVEALRELLRVTEGEYQVRPNDRVYAQTELQHLGPILNSASASLDTHRLGPPVDAALERTTHPLPASLSPQELRMLAYVDGHLSTRDIAAREEHMLPSLTITAVRSLFLKQLIRADGRQPGAWLANRADTLASIAPKAPQARRPSDAFGAHDHEQLEATAPPSGRAMGSSYHTSKPRSRRPFRSSYSSVPPASSREERVSVPSHYHPPTLPTDLLEFEPCAPAEPELEAKIPDEPQHAAISEGQTAQQLEELAALERIEAALEEPAEDGEPTASAEQTGKRPRTLSSITALSPQETSQSQDSMVTVPIEPLAGDPAVIAAAQGQLSESEMPVPSTHLGEEARKQLHNLHQAIANTNAPRFPDLDEPELSQEYAVPGSVPQPEQLPLQPPVEEQQSALPVVGRYEVLARLKRGGMGSVYLCRLSGNAGFRRLFAMKVLHGHLAEQPELLDAFFHEARVLGNIHHTNIIGIADVGSPQQPYLVLDYVEGGSLMELLRASPKLRPPDLVVRMILDALEGLAAAHSATDESGATLQLVHCDITPHNLLVGADGSCRVTDFGIARTHDSDPNEEITRGKPAYIAPERLLRSGADHRADLFSMGVVLYTALTGEEPFPGDSPDAIMRSVLREMPMPPSQVGLRPPPALDWVCMKALSKDPNGRFQSASEMAEHLRRVATREGLLGTSTEVGQWLESALAPTLAARRTAAMRGLHRPSGTARASSYPPAPAAKAKRASDSASFHALHAEASLQAEAALQTAFDAAPPESPSAAEHTNPLTAPEMPSETPGVSTSSQLLQKKQQLIIYALVAIVIGILGWTLLSPPEGSSAEAPRNGPLTGAASPDASTPSNSSVQLSAIVPRNN